MNSAISCVTIVTGVAAGIGNLFLIESHLDIHYYMLLVSVVADLYWASVLLSSVACYIPSALTAAASAVVSTICGETAWSFVTLVALYAVFKGLAMLVVAKASKSVRIWYASDLLPHLKKGLHSSLGPGTLIGEDDVIEEEEQVEQAGPAALSPSLDNKDFYGACGSVDMRNQQNHAAMPSYGSSLPGRQPLQPDHWQPLVSRVGR